MGTDSLSVARDLAANALAATKALPLTFASGLPFVLPSSGNINNTNGSVTVSTAFDYVIGPSYSFFPAGALYSLSPAGWYYTVWTAATIGTIYANTYQNGIPVIPASPAPLTTVAGAYTQATGFDIVGPACVIPGGQLDLNGYIEWNRVVNNNSSAGSKIYNTYLAGTLVQGLTQTTNPRHASTGTIKNRANAGRQATANSSTGDNNAASSVTKSTIDTSKAQIISASLQIATATDFAMIESFYFRAWKVS